MMIHVCDRCNEELETKNYGLMTMVIKGKAVCDGVELCELCTDEILMILDLKTKEVKPEAFVALHEARDATNYTALIRTQLEESPKTWKQLKELLKNYNPRRVSGAYYQMKSRGLIGKNLDGTYFNRKTEVA